MTQTIKIFREDLEIAAAILKRDEAVTRSFFYKDCYPLFRAIYQNYVTDCSSCLEFMNEIYILIMTPSKSTGRCQLENYRGESSLCTWLKVVALYYCYDKKEKSDKMPQFEQIPYFSEENEDIFDRLGLNNLTISTGDDDIERFDIESLLALMPNPRYAELLRLRYLDGNSNEETAKQLGLSMDNYYNNHKRAKSQFISIFKKESYHG